MELPSFTVSEYGLFDSRVKFPHLTQTQDRPVTEYELEFFPTDYPGSAWINGKNYPMQRGRFLCVKPGQFRHSVLHYRCYYVHMSTVDPVLDSLMRQLPLTGFLPHPEDITAIFQELLLLEPETDPAAQLLLQSGICRLIHLLSRSETPSLHTDAHTKIILDAEHYIQTHLTDPLTLEHVASAVNLSPFYFHRLFSNFFGLSPSRYILNCRIANAKLELLKEDCSLSTVAADCGFSSQSYFCYKFKLLTGMSPLQYRRETLSRLEL